MGKSKKKKNAAKAFQSAKNYIVKKVTGGKSKAKHDQDHLASRSAEQIRETPSTPDYEEPHGHERANTDEHSSDDGGDECVSPVFTPIENYRDHSTSQSQPIYTKDAEPPGHRKLKNWVSEADINVTGLHGGSTATYASSIGVDNSSTHIGNNVNVHMNMYPQREQSQDTLASADSLSSKGVLSMDNVWYRIDRVTCLFMVMLLIVMEALAVQQETINQSFIYTIMSLMLTFYLVLFLLFKDTRTLARKLDVNVCQ